MIRWKNRFGDCPHFLLALLLFASGCSLDSFYDDPPSRYLHVRDLEYVGIERIVYVQAGAPTQVIFPGTIDTNFREVAGLSKTVRDSMLTLYAWEDFPPDGAQLEVVLADRRRYKLWVVPARGQQVPDITVKIIERRSPSAIRRQERDRWE